MKTNRQITSWILCIAFAFLIPGASGQEDKSAVEKSVDRGIVFLMSKQQKDGAIHNQHNTTSMTALAIMAMSSAGHMIDDPTPQGEALRKALAYVLRDDRQEKSGYFGGKDGSRMYGHGIICLMLAELLGMGLDEKQDAVIRKKLRKGIELIIWSQERKKPNNTSQFGGWRYTPQSGDSDLSVTIWQLLALRAAKNAGMPVPKRSIDNAVKYLRVCYHASSNKKRRSTDMKSACSYQPGRRPTYASGAAGLLALQVCGQYDAPEVTGSANWLRNYKPKYESDYFFYGTYYYAQGMYQRGGKFATHAREQVERLLLKIQRQDGSWQAARGGEQKAGQVYATSMALLSLSVRYHYLPIYQR